jgi:hypothetical protein
LFDGASGTARKTASRSIRWRYRTPGRRSCPADRVDVYVKA